jgi:acyl-CoA thioesterase
MTDQKHAKNIAEQIGAKIWETDNAAKSAGMELVSISPGAATLTMPVVEPMLNGHQTCHGGYIFMLADTAFAYACNSYNKTTVAAACDISFVKPAYKGDTLTATATEQHHVGRNGIYDIKVTDQSNETIAFFRGKSRTISKTGLLDD